MASSLQLLLRLPPSIRCQAFSQCWQSTPPKHFFNGFSIRTFLNTTRRSAQPIKPPPKPKTFRKTSSPQRSKTRAPQNPSVKPSPPSPYAQTLLNTIGREEVLLYRAPSHTSFVLSAYIFGGTLIFCSYVLASTIATGTMAWWISAIDHIPALIMAAMGTAAILAPSKMIRRVWLVYSKNNAQNKATPTLRFESRPHLLSSIRSFEAPPNDVALDRMVPAFLPEMRCTNVRLNDAGRFTDPAHNVPFDTAAPKAGFWDTLTWNIKRIFVRQGMAYVHIQGRGHWKLDLHDCEVLDLGKPLDRLMVGKEMPDRSLLGKIFKRWRAFSQGA